MGFDWLTGKKDDSVQCEICPKACVIGPGQRGDCRIRVNLDGTLRAVTYGLPSAVHIDPIEKKPLNHFRPGLPILSLATTGCNLHCKNCQNWTLSQTDPEDADNHALPPPAIVQLCRDKRVPMVAFTYSEPLVFYEYTYEGCVAAREAGLDTVLVTAGYANPGPLRHLFEVTSAANIDLKALSDQFYRDVCAGTLKPVLDALVLAKECGVWLEVTHLVVPTLNDEPHMMRALARWMFHNLGPDTPLHVSRFSPHYRLKNLPPPPEETLDRFGAEAREQGLRYVYVGNVWGSNSESTSCPNCQTLLVERRGYVIRQNLLEDTAGRCPTCGVDIAGVWT
ncbi:AmmeMemoRadiSam system radical SAM enzyme [Myxococcota bacterium]